MTDAAEERSSDILEGAGAISDYLKARGFQRMTRKRVYHLKDRDGWPIVRMPGIGSLVARKGELDAFIDRATEGGNQHGVGGETPMANTGRRLRSVGR